jgi:hypothetical protein
MAMLKDEKLTVMLSRNLMPVEESVWAFYPISKPGSFDVKREADLMAVAVTFESSISTGDEQFLVELDASGAGTNYKLSFCHSFKQAANINPWLTKWAIDVVIVQLDHPYTELSQRETVVV